MRARRVLVYRGCERRAAEELDAPNTVQPFGTIKMIRCRVFLKLTTASGVAVTAPLVLHSIQANDCQCGSGMQVLFNYNSDAVGAECATVEQMNCFLYVRGLRDTP